MSLSELEKRTVVLAEAVREHCEATPGHGITDQAALVRALLHFPIHEALETLSRMKPKEPFENERG